MKKTAIHKTGLLLFLLAMLKFTACEQEDLDFYIDCDYCLESIPDSADLIVTVTINDENPYVPLTFYVGDYEDGIVDFVDTCRSDTLYLYSEIGVEYAVMAEYRVGSDTVYAIDGDKMRVVNGEGECYPPCYYIRGGTLDIRLK